MIEEYLREWTYLAVFVLSALPWLESSVVAVLGIGLGLDPIWTTVAALLGNLVVLLLVIFLFDRLQQWRQRRQARKGQAPVTESKKWKRAHHIFVKYGLPGLAVAGPLFIGTEIAAAIAMGLRAPRGPVTFWLTLGMVFWTVLLAVFAYYGIGFIREA
ncbi:small multi-drug export protein [Paenibacillus sp. 1P07SE]|uniref:small multi-drug export protein n=1 Tax=Paenibacillus sp. 1P07SE TaxID=3132209 RepID=UPI0039A4BC83